MPEQRKLIKLGNSSFAIALPKEWIEKSGLKKGDNIFVERNSNGELIVQSKYKKLNGEKEIKINTKGKDNTSIWREFNAAYVNGYDIFTFDESLKKEKLNLIKRITKTLLSLEVVETKDKIVIKDYFNLEETNPENFIRRMDNNFREMLNLLIEILKRRKATIKDGKNIQEIDGDITKFYFLFSRIFFKGIDNPIILTTLKINSSELFDYWWLAFNIERMGDQVKEIVKIMKQGSPNEKKSDKILSCLIKIKKIYVDSMESFYKHSNVLALETVSEGKKILEFCDRFSNDKNTCVAKLSLKLKEIENLIYHNLKIILYTKE